MAVVKQVDISKCNQCGKIIARREAVQLCRDCSGTQGEFPGTVAAAPDPVKGELHEGICTFCGRDGLIDDKDECVACKLDFFSQIGDVTEQLLSAVSRWEQSTGEPASVRGLLEFKRRRSSVARLGGVTATRVR